MSRPATPPEPLEPTELELHAPGDYDEARLDYQRYLNTLHERAQAEAKDAQPHEELADAASH